MRNTFIMIAVFISIGLSGWTLGYVLAKTLSSEVTTTSGQSEYLSDTREKEQAYEEGRSSRIDMCEYPKGSRAYEVNLSLLRLDLKYLDEKFKPDFDRGWDSFQNCQEADAERIKLENNLQEELKALEKELGL